MAHTPGPWHQGQYQTLYIFDVKGLCIATCTNDRDSEALPNALLIAAAPQMLNVLEALVQNVPDTVCNCCLVDDHECKHVCKLHLAIRAAKGE